MGDDYIICADADAHLLFVGDEENIGEAHRPAWRKDFFIFSSPPREWMDVRMAMNHAYFGSFADHFTEDADTSAWYAAGHAFFWLSRHHWLMLRWQASARRHYQIAVIGRQEFLFK